MENTKFAVVFNTQTKKAVSKVMEDNKAWALKCRMGQQSLSNFHYLTTQEVEQVDGQWQYVKGAK